MRRDELPDLLDRLDLGLFAVDRTGTVEYWSEGASRITGYPSDAVTGTPWTSLAGSEEGLTEIAELLVDPEETDDRAQRFEQRLSRPDGGMLHLFGSLLLCRDEQGSVIGAVGSFVEVGDFVSRKRFVRLLTSGGVRSSLLGEAPAIREVLRRIELAANSDVTTLIRGESGTGKELAAREVHKRSARRDQPFVAVNCSALTETLLESELFGHVQGAFTGAVRDKAGLFETADGGTIFLDEIGDVSPLFQVKLLRVLQEREIRRVGDDHPIPVDVRVISATHHDLRQLVAEGTFREDFYYRIRVFEIELPALRSRMEDLPLLVGAFIAELSRTTGKPVEGVTAEVLDALRHYRWPGNVRELRNAIEHAFVSVAKERIGLRDLPGEIQRSAIPTTDWPSGARGQRLEDQDAAERSRIVEALNTCDWNRTRAAERLGISRVTLWKRMRKYRIEEGIFRDPL
ncbi:MAG: sigma 54-interacting transcriptional regulator [Planctomycetes bacterium]|nr:sigma 54-interacting transcriptional regulator [Planctomycetota bacterium]